MPAYVPSNVEEFELHKIDKRADGIPLTYKSWQAYIHEIYLKPSGKPTGLNS
jgi:hypothetical protein